MDFCSRLTVFGWKDKEDYRKGTKMINFEEELKKFHPSLEVEDAEEAIYNQDLTDMADLLVKMMKEAGLDQEEK